MTKIWFVSFFEAQLTTVAEGGGYSPNPARPLTPAPVHTRSHNIFENQLYAKTIFLKKVFWKTFFDE